MSEENDGNRTKTLYTYDYKDRPLTITKGTYEESYVYNDAFLGAYSRVTKTIEGGTNSPDIVMFADKDKVGNIVKSGYILNGVEYSTKYTYDYLGNKVSELTAKDELAGYNYSVKYETDTFGNILTATYDDCVNVLNTYDMLGRNVKSIDPNGNETSYTYNSLGNVTRKEKDFDGSNASIELYEYDGNGNVVSQKISNNAPGESISYSNTTNEYDSRNRLIETSIYDLEQAYTTQYSYDGVGNLLSQTTGNGTSTTSYEYNSQNELSQLTDALGKKESYTYDGNGNIIGKIDRNGNVHTYTYDALNNIICHSVKLLDGTVKSISYSYAPNGNKTEESNENITTEYSYDALGMLIREADTTGIEKVYSYDAAGNRIGFILNKSGNAAMNLSYNYNKLNRLTSLKDSGIERISYIYDNNGNIVEKNYDNGVQTTYGYNSANLITSMENEKGSAVISAYYYTYALDGNQLTKTDKGGKLTEYQYDQVGRLKKETVPGEETSYSYDLNGNRTSKTVVTQDSTYITGYQYDDDNRLLSEELRQSTSTDPETVVEYYYDNNGNQIGKTKSSSDINGNSNEQYEYDGFNNLINFQTAGVTSEYKYNADGLRISKNVNGEITNHVWDGLNMVMETTGDGEVKETYIRGNGLIKTGSGKYYVQNAHGDTTQLTDGLGEVIEDYDYDAFGVEKGDTTQIYNPFRYCGEYFDEELGCVYLRARYYDPIDGRFLAEDTYWDTSNMIYGDAPLLHNKYTVTPDITAIMQSSNLYVYVMNNPILYRDISGLKVYIAGAELFAQAGARINGADAIIWDDNGNIGELNSLSFGAGWLAAGGSDYYAQIDTKNISDVQGLSFELGGGVSVPAAGIISVGGGVDYTVSLGDVKYSAYVYNVGGSVGLPIDAHAQITYSSVNPYSLKALVIKAAIRLIKSIFGDD